MLASTGGHLLPGSSPRAGARGGVQSQFQAVYTCAEIPRKAQLYNVRLHKDLLSNFAPWPAPPKLRPGEGLGWRMVVLLEAIPCLDVACSHKFKQSTPTLTYPKRRICTMCDCMRIRCQILHPAPPALPNLVPHAMCTNAAASLRLPNWRMSWSAHAMGSKVRNAFHRAEIICCAAGRLLRCFPQPPP